MNTVGHISRAEAMIPQRLIDGKGNGHRQDHLFRAELHGGDAIHLDLIHFKCKVNFSLQNLTGQLIVAQFFPANMNVRVLASELANDPREHIGAEKT